MIISTHLFLNSEWFRKPSSKLEKTLRLPKLDKYIFLLFFRRVLVIWLIFSLGLKLFGLSLSWVILIGFLFTIIFELFWLRLRYERYILPKHKKNIEILRRSHKNIGRYSNPELLEYIEDTAHKSAWSIVNIGYLVLPSWGWEIILKTIYPLIARDFKVPYHNLLIGFPNKTTEADIALWHVAQEEDQSRQNEKLSIYLDMYGSRIEDLDIQHPTFREKREAIGTLLTMYKKIPSPETRVKEAEARRLKAIESIQLRSLIPKSFFNAFLSLVQKNVSLREDRRFYEFEFDYYIRSALLLLAKRIYGTTENIFNKTWNEIKYEANQGNASE